MARWRDSSDRNDNSMNLKRNGNSKWKKTTAGTMSTDEKSGVRVEASNVPRLNMNHGFIKSIVRNQIDRDEYDKLLSEKMSSFRHLEKPRKTCDPSLLYVPPHLRNINGRNTKNEKSQGVEPVANANMTNEKEELRKEIRRRLMEQMAKEGHKKLQMTAETMISSSVLIRGNIDVRRRSGPATIAPSRNEALFKLNILGQDGNPVEQIVHAVISF
ncbi:unnamed protein product [Litomosoides sigmodontis]|uniref:Uncharacterized protein n=1 Tax=Litomosoides sigmodontis TaxID=42156 RepID=A0A3P6SEL4_LITSI|nr:unnamed protein product [Litomosoides sigmodontis]